MKATIIIVMFVLCPVLVMSQTQLFNDIQVYDKTSGKSVVLTKPTGLTATRRMNFPVSAGTVGQVLTIESVSGTTVNLKWSTESVNTSTLSDRLTADESVTTAGAATGLVAPAGASKKYRVAGIIRGNRVNAGVSPSDKLIVTLTGPTNSTFASLSIRCYDCSANTTGVPTNVTASSNTVSTTTIDPAGTGSSDYTTFAYGVEGIVIVSTTAGNITVILDDDGSGSNNISIAKNSYIVLTEID